MTLRTFGSSLVRWEKIDWERKYFFGIDCWLARHKSHSRCRRQPSQEEDKRQWQTLTAMQNFCLPVIDRRLWEWMSAVWRPGLTQDHVWLTPLFVWWGQISPTIHNFDHLSLDVWTKASMIYSPRAFFLLAKSKLSVKDDRSFKSHFGTTIDVASLVWDRIRENKLCPCSLRPFHLLWGLLFLKTYSTTEVLATTVKSSCNNVWKWVWIVLRQIQKLKRKVVSNMSPVFVTRCFLNSLWHPHL